MAKAEKRFVEKQKTVTEKVEDGVTLTLTKKEAQAVRELTGNVIGSGEYRTLTSNVYYALRNAGVERYELKIDKPVTFESRAQDSAYDIYSALYPWSLLDSYNLGFKSSKPFG